MRWRKGLRNGDRENGGAWRGGWVEGEGTRDKRWNRLERRRERKERNIGRRKGESLLKAAQKKAKSRFFVTNNVKNVTF
jgi:hypothetical protein